MDIKIQTKSQTFLINIENLTTKDLNFELKRLGIELKDIVIYFYDGDGDKIVIIDDQDVYYAFEQEKKKIRNRIKFYVYYKLREPKIAKTCLSIKDQKESPITDESEIMSKSSNNSQIVEPSSPVFQKREEKLQFVIENFIDLLLREQYEI